MKTKIKTLSFALILLFSFQIGTTYSQNTPKITGTPCTPTQPMFYYSSEYLYLPMWGCCPAEPCDAAIPPGGTTADWLISSPISFNQLSHLLLVRSRMLIGNGEPDPESVLTVNGKITAKDVEVKPRWGDFIFDKDYKLLSLDQVEDFISIHKHLPNIPSEAEVSANGIELGKMNSLLLQKIEELTLYMIELKKENEKLNAKIENLNH
jgi:hypothetical protein